VVGKQLDDRLADASRAAGDDGDLTGERAFRPYSLSGARLGCRLLT